MKLYRNKAWLIDRYEQQGMTIENMAKEAGCSVNTIVNWLSKFGLL